MADNKITETEVVFLSHHSPSKVVIQSAGITETRNETPNLQWNVKKRIEFVNDSFRKQESEIKGYTSSGHKHEPHHQLRIVFVPKEEEDSRPQDMPLLPTKTPDRTTNLKPERPRRERPRSARPVSAKQIPGRCFSSSYISGLISGKRNLEYLETTLLV